MIAWLTSNWGTILVAVILILIVSLIILSLRKDRKQGKSTCGGNCSQCKMCHKE